MKMFERKHPHSVTLRKSTDFYSSHFENVVYKVGEKSHTTETMFNKREAGDDYLKSRET